MIAPARIAAACVVLTLSAAALQAVETQGELGKATRRHERRVVGREERDNGFRQPGGLLEHARTKRPAVDRDLLARRAKEMYRGATYTQSLPTQGPARADGPAMRADTRVRASDADVAETAAIHSASTLSWVHFLVFAGAAGGFLAVGAWMIRNRRRGAEAAAAAVVGGPAKESASWRGRRWVGREMNITMGHRDD